MQPCVDGDARAEADDDRHHGGEDRLRVGGGDAFAVERAVEPPAQHAHERDERDQVGGRDAHGDHAGPLRGRQQVSAGEDQSELQHVHDEHERERRASVFERVERALDDQVRARERQADAQAHQWTAHEDCLRHGHRRQQRARDRERHDDERGGEEAHDCAHGAQRAAQVVARAGHVAVRERLRDLREDRRGHRDGDE